MSTAASLGLICHDVLAESARGHLGDPDDADWRQRYDAVWDAAVARQAENTSTARTWPNYGIYRAAARVLAKGVAREHRAGKDLEPELPLESADGLVAGRADLVVRSPEHEIRDYKTGQIANDAGQPRADYLRQLLIYAALEHDQIGSWPSRVVLVPLDPKRSPVVVPIEPAEARSAQSELSGALEQYNEAVVEQVGPASMASPSADACRFCRFATRCPAFWDAASESWAEDGVVAVAGTILRTSAAHSGGVTVVVENEAGSMSAGEVVISPIETTRLPAASSLEPGMALAGVGLRRRDASTTSATAYSVLAWAPI